MNINIKDINNVDELLLIRNKIQWEITELNINDDDNNNDNIIKQLKNKYMNISNKIKYINNRVIIIDKYKDKNREYIKNNYDIIKDKNKAYQTKRREEFKRLQQFYNDNIKV